MNNKKTILFFGCIFVALIFIFKSFSSYDFDQAQVIEQQREQVTYDQYRVQKEVSKKNDLRRKKTLQAQKKFRLNNKANNNRQYNLAKAPVNRNKPHLSPANNKKSQNKNASKKTTKKTEKKVAKKEGEEDKEKKKEDEDKKNETETEVADKAPEAFNNTASEKLESRDLSLRVTTEDAVVFTTASVPQPQNRASSDQGNNTGTSVRNNDGEEQEEGGDDDTPPTTFVFDPETTTVVGELLGRGDFDSIDSLLRDDSIDKRTAYYNIVEHISNNPESNEELTLILNTHYVNIESVSLLTEHLTNDETSIDEKRASYSYLLQLVNAWPEEGDAQQFNAVFVNGVNNQLAGTESTESSPQNELYLQLSNSIIIKLDQINSRQA